MPITIVGGVILINPTGDKGGKKIKIIAERLAKDTIGVLLIKAEEFDQKNRKNPEQKYKSKRDEVLM